MEIISERVRVGASELFVPIPLSLCNTSTSSYDIVVLNDGCVLLAGIGAEATRIQWRSRHLLSRLPPSVLEVAILLYFNISIIEVIEWWADPAGYGVTTRRGATFINEC